MPRKAVRRTPKQVAASRRNLVKARAAKISRSRYTGKSGLPHVETTIKTYGKIKYVYVNTFKNGELTGELAGTLIGRRLDISDVSKLTKERFGYSINDYSNGGKRSGSPTLEPGISLLTAAARVAGKKAMRVNLAIPKAKSFYVLTGGTPARGHQSWTINYSPAARKRLAGRRVVRVRKKNK